MDLDLRQLRHAHTIALHKSFARAARALHITQPALSRSIQMLEGRLGTRLFDRNTTGVEPTAAGRVVLEQASKLLALADDLASKSSGLREVGTLNIGAGPYPTAMLLGNALARLVNELPEARVNVTPADWSESIEMVRRGELTFAIAESSTVLDEPEFLVTVLARHQAYFAVRSGHPLTMVGEPTLEDIATYPLAMVDRLPPRVLDHLLAASTGNRRSVSPRGLSFTAPSIETLKTLVAQSNAVAPFPLPLIRAELACGTLVILPSPPDWLHLEYGIIRLARVKPSPLAEALIGHLALEDQRIAALEAAAPLSA